MMESWVRFSAQSQAKERVFRAAQYACTLLGYTLQKGGARVELLNTIKQLEAHMSLTRKLMRLGNSAEALQAAKRTVHLSDCVLRLCITVAHLNRAMYFACDNVLYYLFALILNLARDVYDIRLLMDRESRSSAAKSFNSSPSPLTPSPENGGEFPLTPCPLPALPVISARLNQQIQLLITVLRSNPPLLLDLLKNLCDVFIPLDRLGLYPTGSGFVGACGLTSSVLSILTIVHPWLKLKP
ncbi:hypothetical protein cypCar_00029980 [Cyprinus carpio]|nr:hypothetical protein cypCar_00029980 [Cyprinus carpio]